MENKELKEHPIEAQIRSIQLPDTIPVEEQDVKQFVDKLKPKLDILLLWTEVLLDSFLKNSESPQPTFNAAEISSEACDEHVLKFNFKYKDMPDPNEAVLTAAYTADIPDMPDMANVLGPESWLQDWASLVVSYKLFKLARQEKIPWHKAMKGRIVSVLKIFSPSSYKKLSCSSEDESLPGIPAPAAAAAPSLPGIPTPAELQSLSPAGRWFRKMTHYVQVCQVALKVLDHLCKLVLGKRTEGAFTEGAFIGSAFVGSTAYDLKARMSFIMIIKVVAFSVVAQIEHKLKKDERAYLFEECFRLYKAEHKKETDNLKSKIVKHMSEKKSVLEMCSAIHKAKSKGKSDSKQDLVGNVDDVQVDYNFLSYIPVPVPVTPDQESPEQAGATSQASGQEKMDQESSEGDENVKAASPRK